MKYVFEIRAGYYYFEKKIHGGSSIVKGPHFASRFDLDDSSDLKRSNYLKKKFPNSQLIPLESAVEKYEKRQKLRKALNYINSLDSPLELLCFSNKRNWRGKREWLFITLSEFLSIFTIWSILGSGFDSRTIIICVLLGLIEPLFLIITSSELGSMKRKKTADFKKFTDILKKYKFNNIPGFDFFTEHHDDAENIFTYDSNIAYDLFNRVKTFALISFLSADQREDEEALQKILTPMVQDIMNEAVEKYQKHKKIEHEFDDTQKKQLKEQINIDLEVYKKRILKNF